jgi:hypothetical protein
MICPHCKKDIKIPDRAYHNVEAYRDPVLVTTECCGQIINLWSHTSFYASAYDGKSEEDSWGVPKTKK